MAVRLSLEKAPAAVFDFDGTLIRGDSAILLLRHTLRTHPQALRQLPRLAIALLGWLLGRVPRDVVKGVVVGALDSVPESDREIFLKDFHDRVLLPRYRPEALERARWHRAQGHRLIVASASVDVYLVYAARMLEADHLVCTRAVLHPRARLVSRNCRGEEKLHQLAGWSDYPAIDWPDSWTYSDSLSDLPLFRLCGNPVAVNGGRALNRLASRSGWRIVRW